MDRDGMVPTNKPTDMICEEMQEFSKEKEHKIYSEMDNCDSAVGESSKDTIPDLRGTAEDRISAYLGRRIKTGPICIE